jgi:mono/diheme cytochrome c family protein
METRTNVRGVLAAALLCLLLARPAAGQQQPPSEETIGFFRQNCTSCHTIGGGRLAGPDLKDVTTRKDRAWLVRFVLDPKGTIDSGDAYAQQIFREARGVYMQPIPGLQAPRV